jgi:putative lipoprotein (rSAM/lipoprotein system)
MKKIMQSILKCFNAILVALLGVFGFSSCEITGEDDSGVMYMYGPRMPDFAIKGAVVDKTNKEPIQGIKVKLIYKVIGNDGKERILFQTKDVTDNKGNFEFLEGLPPTTLEAHFSDIDGAENGLFENKTIEIDYKKAVMTQGKLTKTIHVELTPKAEETDE